MPDNAQAALLSDDLDSIRKKAAHIGSMNRPTAHAAPPETQASAPLRVLCFRSPPPAAPMPAIIMNQVDASGTG